MDDSWERDARMDRAHHMAQPTWGIEGMMWDDSDWLRAEGEEEELECLSPLELHLQELLSGEEMSQASAERGDSFLQNFDARGSQTFPHG